MSETVTGLIAVTVGVVIFVWDATRNRGREFAWRSEFSWPPDLKSGISRSAIAGAIGAAALISGQMLAGRLGGAHAADSFFYWYVGVLLFIAVIVNLVRWRSSRLKPVEKSNHVEEHRSREDHGIHPV